MPEVTAFTKLIDASVRRMTQAAGITGYDLAEVVGRTQGYTAVRLTGYKPWTTDDLDRIGERLGYANGFGLLDAIRGMSTVEQRQKEEEQDDHFTLAALHDPYKKYKKLGEAAAQEDDDYDI